MSENTGLTPEELAAEDVSELPNREVMSVITGAALPQPVPAITPSTDPPTYDPTASTGAAPLPNTDTASSPISPVSPHPLPPEPAPDPSYGGPLPPEPVPPYDSGPTGGVTT